MRSCHGSNVLLRSVISEKSVSARLLSSQKSGASDSSSNFLIFDFSVSGSKPPPYVVGFFLDCLECILIMNIHGYSLSFCFVLARLSILKPTVHCICSPEARSNSHRGRICVYS